MNSVQDLIAALEKEILQAPNGEAASLATRDILENFSCSCELPDRYCQTATGCYARHLIHLDPQDRYCVVAMVWGPGQGTAVHDHDGTWCVEGCFRGQLRITNYRHLGELPDGRVRLIPQESTEVGVGAVGRLIPPYEHHKLENPFDQPAITLHVYGRELKAVTRFIPDGDAYRVERASLGYATAGRQVS